MNESEDIPAFIDRMLKLTDDQRVDEMFARAAVEHGNGFLQDVKNELGRRIGLTDEQIMALDDEIDELDGDIQAKRMRIENLQRLLPHYVEQKMDPVMELNLPSIDNLPSGVAPAWVGNLQAFYDLNCINLPISTETFRPVRAGTPDPRDYIDNNVKRWDEPMNRDYRYRKDQLTPPGIELARARNARGEATPPVTVGGKPMTHEMLAKAIYVAQEVAQEVDDS